MRVLIVDDILINRRLSSMILEKRGHSVQTAENGIRAIELLEKEDFDLVLMDLQMPVMDGFEAGMDGFIAKPLQREEFLKIVERYAPGKSNA